MEKDLQEKVDKLARRLAEHNKTFKEWQKLLEERVRVLEEANSFRPLKKKCEAIANIDWNKSIYEQNIPGGMCQTCGYIHFKAILEASRTAHNEYYKNR